jgi:hypothetical protein
MGGSDFWRTRPKHTYADALGFLRDTDELSDAEKDLLLGATRRDGLHWPHRDGLRWPHPPSGCLSFVS